VKGSPRDAGSEQAIHGGYLWHPKAPSMVSAMILSTRARSVLVVDDEPALRQTLTILLERHGLEVTAASGQREGVQALSAARAPFPVVLTDLSMPDGSGLDVLAAAKSRNSATQVILLTAHSTVENAVAAMAGGAYDFVTKPFESAELVALV